MALGHDPIPAAAIRPLRRSEYERLAAAGAFRDEKVELLYGRIVRMSPQGNPHAFSITQLTKLLVRAIGDRANVRVQMPFAAPGESLPEPNVAVVPTGDYLDAPPSQAHVLVEVAESSLAIDRGPKAQLYAEAGVPAYWVVNLVEGVVEVHDQPGTEGYGRVIRCAGDDELRVPEFGDVVLRAREILPPRG